jgi:serine/threonine-protein kinase
VSSIRDLEEHLATLGVAPSIDLALDATITPDTLARSHAGAGDAKSASVGPLPRIALSGVPTSSSTTDPTASADLEILAMLGEGGMGRVHLARQRSLGREVAIKMLKDETANAYATEMLRVEATIMGRLEHPNVVPVHAVGLDGAGRLVLVMKRIDGAPWRDLLRDPDHPRWQELAPRSEDRLYAHLGVLVQVANALELAHQRGVIHRDVKPENVLLGSHGEVYLADWGVALRMDDREGQDLVGTPAYMAPEMVVGLRAKIDPRTDVFLLGATLHEILTGHAPNQGPTLHAALLAAMDPSPPVYDASVPAELAAIARRAMAKDPADRFASALEFRRALDEVRNHRGSIALTRAARTELASLEAIFAAEKPSFEGVDRKLTECRFALASALREWPGNVEASRALQACLQLALRHELARENAAAARELLAELEAPDPALEERVAAVEQRVKARDAELARLEALDADSDLWVGMGARVTMFVLLALMTVAITGYVIYRSGGEVGAFGPWDLVRFGSIVFGVIAVIVTVFAKRLLANGIGRRVTAMFFLATGGMLVHRIIAAELDVAPAATLTMDLVILGVVGAGSGLVIPRSAWIAVPAPIGIVLCVALRAHVPVIFSLTTLAIIVVMMIVGALELRARRPTGPSRPAGSADRPPRPAGDTRSK